MCSQLMLNHLGLGCKCAAHFKRLVPGLRLQKATTITTTLLQGETQGHNTVVSWHTCGKVWENQNSTEAKQGVAHWQSNPGNQPNEQPNPKVSQGKTLNPKARHCQETEQQLKALKNWSRGTWETWPTDKGKERHGRYVFKYTESTQWATGGTWGRAKQTCRR